MAGSCAYRFSQSGEIGNPLTCVNVFAAPRFCLRTAELRYQGALATFLDYVCDPRYGWLVECQQRVGAVPVQVCLAENTAAHVADYEGRPERRPLSRGELQMFFDVADERVQTVQSRGCKGWPAAFRDATLFKVIYGWGLRRREAVMLDVEDFTTNPAAP
jgi:integrase